MRDRAELAAWLRLSHTPHVGLTSALALLKAFGSPVAAVRAPAAQHREVIGSRAAQALAKPHPAAAALFTATVDWLQRGSPTAPHDVIALGDPRYPAALLEIADPPLILYTQGDPAWLDPPRSVAVVGSRQATPQGLAHARAFSSALSQAGVTVVSGLALGIDAAAHDGALDHAGGTVAVVATGLDQVYPRRHTDLAQRIAAKGVVVSEQPIGAAPLREHFPKRNRIIAGLTRGTLVVEAALASGTLITARLAAECNRDVFAIPGSIRSPQAEGCHALIKQGAKLVDCPQDVLDELGLPAPAPLRPHARGRAPCIRSADPVLTAMAFDPVDLDTLCVLTGQAGHTLSARLLELELAGSVARLPGQRFQRL